MTQPWRGGRADTCAQCGTELPPHAVACPACGTLVYSDKLKSLAASADAATASGDLSGARGRWQTALKSLPPDSKQYAAVSSRIADLDARIDPATSPAPGAKSANPDHPAWRRAIGALVTGFLLILGKLKFLLLGLTKASTFFSMFAFFGVYWSHFRVAARARARHLDLHPRDGARLRAAEARASRRARRCSSPASARS